ncbi:MAG: 5-formyltetrahydrofolate cyclo-ligase [Plesiomonas shigelloides]
MSAHSVTPNVPHALSPDPHSAALCQQLRRTVRERRRRLSAPQQHAAANALAERALQHPRFQQAQHIALYLAVDGELDTQPLIEALWQCGKQVYLPVLHPFSRGHLLFLAYRPDSPMRANRFGILEPELDLHAVCPLHQLELIATPLVAFDAHGHRLGMGGGFYDRTLAPIHHSSQPHALNRAHAARPYPIGLAHDCQQVAHIPRQIWDIPLPEILTPTRHWDWRNS